MFRRPGHSLIELLTALVLLSVGLAAFARAAGAVARLETDARLKRALAAVMQARLDSLAAESCASARSGEAHGAGIGETWQATGDGRRWLMTDSIGVRARPTLMRRYAAAVPCQR